MSENIIVKYSEFIGDDGGFEKVLKDFDKLGDELIKKAEKLRGQINLVDSNNIDLQKQYEKETMNIKAAFDEMEAAKKDVLKIEKEYEKQIKDASKTENQRLDKLAKLDKELQTHKTNLKELNKLGTINGKVIKDVNGQRAKEQLAIKKVRKEIRDEQKEILEKNKLSRKEQKLIDAKITLQKEEVRTLDDVHERMTALRTVVKSLDLEEDAEEIAKLNKEIDELSELNNVNSDSWIQQKNNIGNYEESVISALQSTGLFSSELGILNEITDAGIGAIKEVVGEIGIFSDALDEVVNLIKGNTAATKADTAAKEKNAKATVGLSKAVKALNTAAKASGILFLLTALTALAGVFNDTRSGAIKTEKVMNTLSSVFNSITQVAGIFFTTISNGVSSLFDSLGSLAQNFKGKSVPEIILGIVNGDIDLGDEYFNIMFAQLKNIKDGYDNAVRAINTAKDSVVEGLENIEAAYRLEDKISKTNIEVAKLQGEFEKLQMIADDSTKSLATQLSANERALIKSEQIQRLKIQLAKDELELANEKLKQNAKENIEEAKRLDFSKKGKDFAEEVLALAQSRGASLKISNDLIKQQQDAVVKLVEAENEGELTIAENQKKRREIQRDLFEQNLDLLIDLTEADKAASESIVNNTANAFKKRGNEFNRFLIEFRENSGKQLDEFTKQAKANGLDLDFKIDYDENGDFELFINDTKLATDNIVELNSQLQSTGMNEIEINRFREFLIETKNGVKDFKELNKEVVQLGINTRQLKEEVSINSDELKALDKLQDKIDSLVVSLKKQNLTEPERKAIVEQLENLEKEKTDIVKFAEFQRLQARKDAIDEELETVEKTSERYYELLKERQDIQKQLRENSIENSKGFADELNEKIKEANKKAKDEWEKFANDVKNILSSILDKAVEVQQDRVKAAEKATDQQQKLVEIQQQRATEGLENTLAFEQKELRKREAEKIRQQQKEQRLEKINSLYSSYANYSQNGEKNALLKALRDFAILESIAASFEDGGIAGIDGYSHVKTNKGITTGRSHNMRGGVLAFHQGGEGFFSRDEVNNMGHENFYKLKEMANSGKLNDNFFSKQQKLLVVDAMNRQQDTELLHEFREMKKAFQSKPVSNFDFVALVNGVLQIMETQKSKNKTKRFIHKTKKPRL